MILGAQLYTLRAYTQSERDFEISMERVAKIGYKTVQVSAIGDIPAGRVREICDRYSLGIVLTHTNPDRVLNDTERVIEEHNIMGCDYIGLGSMPERYRAPEWFDRFRADYREPAEKIAAAGKLLMYHNHNFEFQRFFDGKNMMERLMEDFSPAELGFTLDTYWVQAAGADVVQWIEKLSGRMPCVHLKDMEVIGWETHMAPVMEGNMNFPAILEAFGRSQGTEYLLVEQDTCRESPFTCLEKSYNNLAKLGYR